jgi:hypothetical protein
MFQFPWLPRYTYGFSASYWPITTSGFPHSDIHASTLAYSSAWHFGVRPVLLRLLAPRHPPCALPTFTCRSGRFVLTPRSSLPVYYISQCVTPRDAVTQSRCRYVRFRPKTSPNTTNTVFLRRYRRITFVISFPRYSLSSPSPP